MKEKKTARAQCPRMPAWRTHATVLIATVLTLTRSASSWTSPAALAAFTRPAMLHLIPRLSRPTGRGSSSLSATNTATAAARWRRPGIKRACRLRALSAIAGPNDLEADVVRSLRKLM